MNGCRLFHEGEPLELSVTALISLSGNVLICAHSDQSHLQEFISACLTCSWECSLQQRLYNYQVPRFITDLSKKWKQTTFHSGCVQFKPKCNNLPCTYLCVHVTTLCWIASSHNLIRLLNASLWSGRSLWAAKRASAWLNLADQKGITHMLHKSWPL